MFLFAKLVCENLYEQTNREEFEMEMDPKKFPEGLTQAYGCTSPESHWLTLVAMIESWIEFSGLMSDKRADAKGSDNCLVGSHVLGGLLNGARFNVL